MIHTPTGMRAERSEIPYQMTAQRDPQIRKYQPSTDQIHFNRWKEHVRDRRFSRAQVVRCPAVLYCSAVSLCRLDRETLEELADDVPLWSLDVDLGAGRDTLVCRWRAKEIGLL